MCTSIVRSYPSYVITSYSIHYTKLYDIRVGDVVTAEMQPATDAQGRPTKLVDTVFSTIPGSPAYVGKATSFAVNQPEHGLVWEFIV